MSCVRGLITSGVSGVPSVAKEDDLKIISKLDNLLGEGEAAMAIIAPYRGLRVTPRAVLYPYIDFPEEFNVSRALEDIKEHLLHKDLLEEGRIIKRLYLLIQSPGGSVVSSFKVAKLIRESAREVISFIIHFALSGGTLIVLASNKIVMGPVSHVSPIDIQITYRGIYVSSNDIIRAFEGITSLFEEISEEHAPYPWKVVAKKMDPIMIQEAIDTNVLAKMYALRLLQHEFSSFKDRASDIVETLVEGYPTHDYVIDCEELKRVLGNDFVVCVDELSEDDNIRRLWQVFETWFSKYKDVASDRHIIRYYIKRFRAKEE